MSSKPEPYVFIGGTSEPGGLHVHTADAAMAVAAAGHPVTIICPSVDHFSAMFTGNDVTVEVIPDRRPDESPRRYWRKHLAGHRAAVAVLCRGKLCEGVLSELAYVRMATKRLYTIEHRDFDRPWAYARSSRMHGMVMRAFVRRSVVVSEEIARSAATVLGLDGTRVATCLNWVDPAYRPANAQQRAAAKAALGLPPDALVIGYHGRLAPEKRIDAFIDAFATTHRARAVFVGDGWKRDELEARVAACGLTDRVRFAGWLPDPASAVAAFDIAVLPSLSEGFPLGLMEAMASGAACLAHPMSSTRTLIQDGENGALADLSDPAVFSRALSSLIELPSATRDRLGAAASRTIAREFSRARRLPDVLRALGINNPEAAVAALPARARRLDFARPAP